MPDVISKRKETHNELARFARVEFAPPRYLSLPTAGIDISTSGIKIAELVERSHGLELNAFGEEQLQLGAIVGGEIADPKTVSAAVAKLTKAHGILFGNIALPESRGYLFAAEVAGRDRRELRASIEQHLDEYVPLPPAEVTFDFVVTKRAESTASIVGVGYARRVVEESIAVLEEAGVSARSIESENFALPRALLPLGDAGTVLIIDIGKTTTKLLFVAHSIPRYATTLDIGGHALTLAVQKHFGVTEQEAKRVKAEKGIVSALETEEYIAAMLSTVSALREEIGRRLEYWRTHAPGMEREECEPLSRIVLAGGNATVRGLPEYLEAGFRLPVELGDVFTNLAKRDDWLPPIDYLESLAYGTAIGLALRDYAE